MKRLINLPCRACRQQPPSGGCVLKPRIFRHRDFFAHPAAFRRLCVETTAFFRAVGSWCAAAFRRLCVETAPASPPGWAISQPPSGGCVLKPSRPFLLARPTAQPPSGGCVLKPSRPFLLARPTAQPPSGGCVLKPAFVRGKAEIADQPPSGGCVLKLPRQRTGKPAYAAAFRRLCVETYRWATCRSRLKTAAAFRRLCVETPLVLGYLP